MTVLASRADTATSADAKKQVRRAAAHTAIGDVALLGGIITIHGLRWDLEQTITGADGRADQEHVDAGFTFANISVGLPGLPLVTIPVPTPAQLPAVMTQVNGILGPLGLQLRLPTVGGNPDARSHTVSPLTLAIGGRSSILGPVIGTLANDPSFQELTRLLGKTLFDAKDCKELGGLLSVLSPELDATYNTLGGSYPLLVAVITGALGGTGEVQLNIGGVETRIDDEYFPPLSFAPPGPGAPTPGFAGTPAVPGRLGGPGVTTPGRPPAPGGSTQALVSTKTVCRDHEPGRPAGLLARSRPGGGGPRGPVHARAAGARRRAAPPADVRRPRGEGAHVTTSISHDRRGSEARLLRGYGPLLAMIVSFLAMALLAPTVAPENRVAVASRQPAVGGAGPGTAGAVGTPGATVPGSAEAATRPGTPRAGPPPAPARRSRTIRTPRRASPSPVTTVGPPPTGSTGRPSTSPCGTRARPTTSARSSASSPARTRPAARPVGTTTSGPTRPSSSTSTATSSSTGARCSSRSSRARAGSSPRSWAGARPTPTPTPSPRPSRRRRSPT